MKTEEIIEGNKLIAEFMGAYSIDNFDNAPNIIKPYIRAGFVMFHSEIEPMKEVKAEYSLNDLKYHSSWDWLMPVRQKIIKLFDTEFTMIPFTITSHYTELWIDQDGLKFNKIIGCYLESSEKEKYSTELEAVWHLCVDFIKWYNENKK